jgi:hypothetical protein
MGRSFRGARPKTRPDVREQAQDGRRSVGGDRDGDLKKAAGIVALDQRSHEGTTLFGGPTRAEDARNHLDLANTSLR